MNSQYPLGPNGSAGMKGQKVGAIWLPNRLWGILSRSWVRTRRVGLYYQCWLEFWAGRELRSQGSFPISPVVKRGHNERNGDLPGHGPLHIRGTWAEEETMLATGTETMK